MRISTGTGYCQHKQTYLPWRQYLTTDKCFVRDFVVVSIERRKGWLCF